MLQTEFANPVTLECWYVAGFSFLRFIWDLEITSTKKVYGKCGIMSRLGTVRKDMVEKPSEQERVSVEILVQGVLFLYLQRSQWKLTIKLQEHSICFFLGLSKHPKMKEIKLAV